MTDTSNTISIKGKYHVHFLEVQVTTNPHNLISRQVQQVISVYELMKKYEWIACIYYFLMIISRVTLKYSCPSGLQNRKYLHEV